MIDEDDRYKRLSELVKMPSGIERIRISRWSDFFRLLNFFSRRDTGWQWIFRGQEDATWRLQSAFERDVDAYEKFLKRSEDADASRRKASGIFECEKTVVEEFRRLVAGSGLLPPGMIDALKDGWVEWLALLQHYHGKTRLLDFTYSFAVAAYFAYETAYTGRPRSIWAINLDALVHKAVKVMENVYRHRREHVQNDRYGEGTSVWPKDVTRTFRGNFIEVANDIITGKVDCGSGIIPIVIPGNNPRLMAQYGLFLYQIANTVGVHSFERNLADLFAVAPEQLERLSSQTSRIQRFSGMSRTEELKDRVLLKIDFDPCMEARALDVLEQMQMTPRQLFPDLEGLAKGVRYWR